MASSSNIEVDGVIYASKTEAIMALAALGLSHSQIGVKVGSGTGSVGAIISQQRRKAAKASGEPSVTPGLWTPEKRDKVRRLFGQTVVYIADAVQVPPAELLKYVLHGVVPPSQKVDNPDDIRWRGEAKTTPAPEHAALPPPPAAPDSAMLPREAFEAPDTDPDVVDGDQFVEPAHCSMCGDAFDGSYLMCDEQEGAWCPDCFEHHPCGKGEHGEGCSTLVIYADPKPPSPVVAGAAPTRGSEPEGMPVPPRGEVRKPEVAPPAPARFPAAQTVPGALAQPVETIAPTRSPATGLFPAGRMVRLVREDGKFLHESLQGFTDKPAHAWEGTRVNFDAVKAQMPKVVARLMFEVVP